MKSPKPMVFRQPSAAPDPGGRFGFAPTRSPRQAGVVGRILPWVGLRRNCYPSSCMRLGPSQTGPHVFGRGQVNADAVRGAFFPFESVQFTVESCAIRNQTRGSKPCANPFSLSLFFPHRWPVACKTPPRVVLRALLRVQPSLMRWMKTWSQAPLWAALRARQPVASKWGCRPANHATDARKTDKNALTGATDTTDGVVRAYRPVGPVSHFARPSGQPKGEPCSKKS